MKSVTLLLTVTSLRMSSKFVLFSLLFLNAIAEQPTSAGEANLNCIDSLNIIGKRGRPIKCPKELWLKANCFLLGKGVGGGTVYRVIPINLQEKEFVLKDYFYPEILVNDLVALEYLRNIFSNRTFRIIKTLRQISATRVQLESVRGRSLASLLADPSVSKKAKIALQQRYEELLIAIQSEIGRKATINEFKIISGWDDRPRTFMIKLRHIGPESETDNLMVYVTPDNVVVENESFQLVLIDAH